MKEKIIENLIYNNQFSQMQKRGISVYQYKNDWIWWCYKRKHKAIFLSAIQNINNWRLWHWKTNASLNLIKKQHDDDYSIIDQIYLYVKDPNEAKCQYHL